jgi:hypothetical protein
VADPRPRGWPAGAQIALTAAGQTIEAFTVALNRNLRESMRAAAESSVRVAHSWAVLA